MFRPTRRAFVVGAAGVAAMCAIGGVGRMLNGEKDLLRPPGAQNAERFEALCLKCDRCRSACPQGCISIADLEDGLVRARTPKIDFHKGFCDFCGQCADVCPTGAIEQGFDSAAEKIGVATIDSAQCLAYRGGGCRKCVDVCPYDAIAWQTSIPVIDESCCNGCGVCENACPSNSLRSFSGVRDTRGINVVLESGKES